MALLYQPSSSGHWHAADEEHQSTSAAMSEFLGGVSVPDSDAERTSRPAHAGKPIMTVQLQGQLYQVPEPCGKQFYRELTFLSDEEMVEKYALVPCSAEGCREGRRASTDSKASSAGGSVRSQ